MLCLSHTYVATTLSMQNRSLRPKGFFLKTIENRMSKESSAIAVRLSRQTNSKALPLRSRLS